MTLTRKTKFGHNQSEIGFGHFTTVDFCLSCLLAILLCCKKTIFFDSHDTQVSLSRQEETLGCLIFANDLFCFQQATSIVTAVNFISCADLHCKTSIFQFLAYCREKQFFDRFYPLKALVWCSFDWQTPVSGNLTRCCRYFHCT